MPRDDPCLAPFFHAPALCSGLRMCILGACRGGNIPKSLKAFPSVSPHSDDPCMTKEVSGICFSHIKKVGPQLAACFRHVFFLCPEDLFFKRMQVTRHSLQASSWGFPWPFRPFRHESCALFEHRRNTNFYCILYSTPLAIPNVSGLFANFGSFGRWGGPLKMRWS